MSHIYKYKLPANHGSISELPIPAKALVLDVQAQFGELVLWAIFEDSKTKSKKPQTRKFITCYTGNETGPKLSQIKDYIGTAIVNSLVYHVFEIK